MPQDVQRLMSYLGTNPDLWPQDRLINLPSYIDVQGVSKRIAEAVRIAELDKTKAAQMIRDIDEAPLKRWFVDVAQHAGKWRVTHNPRYTENRNVKKAARKNPPRQLIQDLFRRDCYHCRYCQSPVVGDRTDFIRLARHLSVPELVTTGSNEQRHGIYLMFRASHDHIKPHYLGGNDELGNLVTACWPCQFGKYRYTLDELKMSAAPGPITTDDRWKRTLELGLRK